MTGAPSQVVGDPLPVLERELRVADLVAYAGATWDWHRLHHDQAYAQDRGLLAPIVDGQMLGALLAEQVQDHFGPRARITGMGFHFNAMVYAGERVIVAGRIAELAGGGSDPIRLTIEQSVTTEGGQVAIRDAYTVVEVRA